MTKSLSASFIDQKEPYVLYHIGVFSAKEHLFEVSMQVHFSKHTGAQQSNSIIVALPAWIPGSYMIRDFSRHLHNLHCENDRIDIQQLTKQEWQISHKDGLPISEFTLKYLIFANDLSVRSAFINDEYAFFNPCCVCLSVKNAEQAPHYLHINRHHNSKWDNTATALERQLNSPLAFSAPDYFTLIDHPVLLGEFDDYCFDVMGHRFHLVFSGQHAFDFARMERDLTLIIEHHISLFGMFPCPEYWFITLVCNDGFGGLEHLSSTVLQYSRFSLPMQGESESNSKEYLQFLALCSHELFHAWHVKRIKPAVMHQPNLFSEVYTPQLWIYEGFTSFYDDLSLARTKIMSPLEYVKLIDSAITRLMQNPGRLKQSVSTSSFEAWNKFYKQDAGSVNHIVSYYNKGAIIALCLDITLRQQSNNQVTLDTLMKILWERYGKNLTGTLDDVILTLCKSEFDLDLTSFLHLATRTSMDLPLPTLLQSIGLKLHMRASHDFQDKGGTPAELVKYDIGGVLAMSDKQLKVLTVQEQRALSEAGIYVGDIIVAFDKWQCDDKLFLKLLNTRKLGETVALDVLRDGRLLTLPFTVKPVVPDTAYTTIADSALFNSWLGVK